MSDQPRYHVFVAQPNAGSIMPCCVTSMNMMTSRHKVSTCVHQFGDVAHNFNMLLCEALNSRRSAGLTHFAMLHSDIMLSTPNWLDILLEEMDRVDADIMSAIVPIKDLRGLTTTGIRYPGVWGTRRFCMKEILELPETFSIADTECPDQILAINTGCWVCRLPVDSWPDRFPGFTDKYKITWEDGRAVPWFDSEDWLFSDWAQEQGLKVFVTRKVHASHMGGMAFPNNEQWGQWETDKQAPVRPATEALRELPPPHIRIETEKPIAVDSIDHTNPLGTVADNSTSSKFNRKLFELIPAEKVRLLDLGCAGGGLVRSILESGGFAVGVEGSDISRRLNRAEWGVIPDWLFTADITKPFQLANGRPLKFNVITGWEVLEHIPEDKIQGVLMNILTHADPEAIFIGSISRNVEPHHATARPKEWWIERLSNLWIRHAPELEAHFGNDLVRGSNDPGAVSFSYAARIVE